MTRETCLCRLGCCCLRGWGRSTSVENFLEDAMGEAASQQVRFRQVAHRCAFFGDNVNMMLIDALQQQFIHHCVRGVDVRHHKIQSSHYLTS